MNFAILPEGVRDLSPWLVNERGEYVVLPASELAETSWQERATFGHHRAMYVLPTVELVEWLRVFIGNRSAVEVGSGCGALARAVGMRATDNYLQTFPEVASLYRMAGQPLIEYGPDVERIDANEAARLYRPDVIVGAWMTHRYNPAEHGRGGSVYGPDFDDLLEHCADLVLICNTSTHALHPMLARPHQRITPPWLFSRAQTGRDFIGVWKGAKE